MVQINYGAKQEKGFIEVLSMTLNVVLEQPETSQLSVTEWLTEQGINLDLRTKDRIHFERLSTTLIHKIGLTQTTSFLMEIKKLETFESNEAMLSTKKGYSAEQLTKTIHTLLVLPK